MCDPCGMPAPAPRLAPVNQLAAGIAEELGNLLTPSLGYSELLLLTLDPSGRERAQAEEIRYAAERSRRIVQKLHAVGSDPVLTVRPADLNEIARSLEAGLRDALPEGIRMSVAWSPGPLPVRADRARLAQAITGIVASACEAMPAGGALSLETRAATVAEKARARRAGLAGAGASLLRVGDTGPGFDAYRVVSLDDPGFIGDRGLDAGLCLATAQGIVRQHGGVLLIDSDPATGTVVTLCLPDALLA